jgi:hypothetical protein
VDQPPPEWQRRFLGEHYFQRVTALVISPLREPGDQEGPRRPQAEQERAKEDDAAKPILQSWTRGRRGSPSLSSGGHGT